MICDRATRGNAPRRMTRKTRLSNLGARSRRCLRRSRSRLKFPSLCPHLLHRSDLVLPILLLASLLAEWLCGARLLLDAFEILSRFEVSGRACTGGGFCEEAFCGTVRVNACDTCDQKRVTILCFCKYATRVCDFCFGSCHVLRLLLLFPRMYANEWV